MNELQILRALFRRQVFVVLLICVITHALKERHPNKLAEERLKEGLTYARIFESLIDRVPTEVRLLTDVICDEVSSSLVEF